MSLDNILYYHLCEILQYDHLELSKRKSFLYSNQPTKVDSNTCPDFVYIYHLCFRSNLSSYQSFQSPREGGVIKSEKSTLQSNQLNFGTENRKRLLRCLCQLIWIVDSLPSLLWNSAVLAAALIFRTLWPHILLDSEMIDMKTNLT